jgi:hypothetical protein
MTDDAEDALPRVEKQLEQIAALAVQVAPPGWRRLEIHSDFQFEDAPRLWGAAYGEGGEQDLELPFETQELFDAVWSEFAAKGHPAWRTSTVRVSDSRELQVEFQYPDS